MANWKLGRLGWLVALGVAGPAVAGADVIYLTNGRAIEVTAWRDSGDAVEAALGGGIVRIQKIDIQRIDGTPSQGDLRMYSAPPTAGPAPTGALDGPAAVKAMLDLLQQGQGLFAQTVLTATEKAGAFRRLGERWQALTVPEPLREVYTRGQQALQIAADAFTVDAQGTVADAKERVESAATALKDAQERIRKASGG